MNQSLLVPQALVLLQIFLVQKVIRAPECVEIFLVQIVISVIRVAESVSGLTSAVTPSMHTLQWPNARSVHGDTPAAIGPAL